MMSTSHTRSTYLVYKLPCMGTVNESSYIVVIAIKECWYEELSPRSRTQYKKLIRYQCRTTWKDNFNRRQTAISIFRSIIVDSNGFASSPTTMFISEAILQDPQMKFV